MAAQVPKTSAAAPLLVKIVQNLERDPSNEKFRSINLEGKAGAKLVSEPAAMTLLATVGFETQGSRLVAAGAPPAGAAAAVARALAPPASPLVAAAQRRRHAQGRGQGVARRVPSRSSSRRAATPRRKPQERRPRPSASGSRRSRRSRRTITRANTTKIGHTTTEGVPSGGKDINTFRGKYGEDKGG